MVVFLVMLFDCLGVLFKIGVMNNKKKSREWRLLGKYQVSVATYVVNLSS